MKLILGIFLLLLVITNVYAEKYNGIAISEVSEIQEVAPHVNAIGVVPNSAQELENFIDEAERYNLSVVVELARMFWDGNTYTWHNISNISAILNNTWVDVAILLDEPMWHIRNACQEGSSIACDEIANDYPTARNTFQILSAYVNLEIIYVEAYKELQLQNGQLQPFNSAKYVGFDCYGPIGDCNGESLYTYGEWVYNSLLSHQKMYLVPGAFDFEGVENHIEWYFDIYLSNPDLFGGIGVFTYGDIDGVLGAKNYTNIIDKLVEQFARIN